MIQQDITRSHNFGSYNSLNLDFKREENVLIFIITQYFTLYVNC